MIEKYPYEILAIISLLELLFWIREKRFTLLKNCALAKLDAFYQRLLEEDLCGKSNSLE